MINKAKSSFIVPFVDCILLRNLACFSCQNYLRLPDQLKGNS